MLVEVHGADAEMWATILNKADALGESILLQRRGEPLQLEQGWQTARDEMEENDAIVMPAQESARHCPTTLSFRRRPESSRAQGKS